MGNLSTVISQCGTISNIQVARAIFHCIAFLEAETFLSLKSYHIAAFHALESAQFAFGIILLYGMI